MPDPRPTPQPTGFLATLALVPTTQFRICVGIALAVIYVVGILLAMVFKQFNESTPMQPLYIVGSFILIQMGLDVAQFTAKRATYTSGEPPGAKDIEDQVTSKKTT